MMPSIPSHFITAKSEASSVNTQVITDKIQEQMKMGRDRVGIRSQASAEAAAERRHSKLCTSEHKHLTLSCNIRRKNTLV